MSTFAPPVSAGIWGSECGVVSWGGEKACGREHVHSCMGVAISSCLPTPPPPQQRRIPRQAEPDPWSGSRSRGELPKRFLESTKCPSEFAEEIVKEADQYNGFNLIVADLCTKSMFYISNRPKGKPVSLLEVLPGIHVLSNANLDSPWPKAERLRRGFSEVLASCRDEELCMKDIVEELMCDKTKAERNMLPMTGCSPEWELEVSSIFIETHRKQGLYGTRNMGALSVKTSGEVSFYERYMENSNWNEHVFQYHVEQL
ncbi:ser Thr-rich protein T10 in DGCR [Musa troglodytarum]|uniref:Ser Thr-rich protein T10 in DGCR n=1 Tax=Musa troglodytarum TaxID=320322 RepID=A0A9E7EM24_9LILI|nr:ser Thr-rich protein T10 in DGCR [Musa troglodytarum]